MLCGPNQSCTQASRLLSCKLPRLQVVLDRFGNVRHVYQLKSHTNPEPWNPQLMTLHLNNPKPMRQLASPPIILPAPVVLPAPIILPTSVVVPAPVVVSMPAPAGGLPSRSSALRCGILDLSFNLLCRAEAFCCPC